MSAKILAICDQIIEYAFYLLLFLVPLVLTPLNYELFEYNKILFTYALTIIIAGAWIIKMIINRRVLIRRTPLDIPLVLFFLSQFLSYLFSIDRHVSLWGYYSRFHGGLLSTISYLFLYWALVSNLDKEKVFNGLRLGLLSGTLVALYAVAEHFGIDAKYWVQDVKNRVFSTLGQPNWLAAYLSILIPIAVALGLQNLLSPRASCEDNHESGLRNFVGKIFHLPSLFIILASLFYLALLYTKSRSGFLGFWAGMVVFGIFILFLSAKANRATAQFLRSSFANKLFRRVAGAVRQLADHRAPASREARRTSDGGEARQDPSQMKPLYHFLIFIFSFLILTFLVGSPFAQINRYLSLAGLTHAVPVSITPPPGGTESGEIRKIVWKGAVEVFKHYPLFGSGVETFAFSYYQYRPVEHNLVSEWDFLYNKAHNEYLNYLATTGAFGLGSYLLLIGWFLIWNVKQFKTQKAKAKIKIENSKLEQTMPLNYNSELLTLNFALLASYVSILVSNFFGFSVVTVAVFFFLIPAFSFILSGVVSDQKAWVVKWGETVNNRELSAPLSRRQIFSIIITVFLGVLGLLNLGRLWLADIRFARGYNLNRIEEYSQAYDSLKQAIKINPSEPLYRDELSSTAAILAIEAVQNEEATQAAILAQEAIYENQKALEVSPRNVNFWKTRTRVFYTLSVFDEEYNQEALEAIKMASELAPTDAKVFYNLAIIYGRVEENEKAIETLKETIKLKPDYRDAHYALALYLKTAGKDEEAVKELKYILEKISPDDQEAKEMLQTWGLN